jgi:RecJ-like exonuclease
MKLEICPVCKGKGFYEEEVCVHCDGMGDLEGVVGNIPSIKKKQKQAYGEVEEKEGSKLNKRNKKKYDL